MTMGFQLTLNDRENNTEAPVWVEYGTANAEPGAGIKGPYGYVKSVSMWIPALGSIQVQLDAFFAEIVEEAINDHIFEIEYNRG